MPDSTGMRKTQKDSSKQISASAVWTSGQISTLAEEACVGPPLGTKHCDPEV